MGRKVRFDGGGPGGRGRGGAASKGTASKDTTTGAAARGGGRKDDEEDEYMRRIRSRAEMEPDSDEYEEEDDEEDQSQDQDASDGGASDAEDEEDSDEEEDGSGGGFRRPGEGYDSDEDGEGDDDGDEKANDPAARARAEALAAVRGLPLAERLALMASGALDHDASNRRWRRQRQGQHAGPDAGKEKGGTEDKPAAAAAGGGAVLTKPKNKHAPVEVSSKRPVSRFRVVVPPAPGVGPGGKRKARDPRFDSAVGRVNYDAFRKAYSFLEDYQQKEAETLQKALKKAKSQAKAAEIKAALGRIQQERSERKRHDRKEQLLRQAKRAERDKVAAGKTPFFLKKREKRRLELEDRYEQLAKAGKLEKALAKKRRRNAAKDHRWLPRTRRVAEGAGGAGGGDGAGPGGRGGGRGDEDDGRGWG